MTYGPDQFAAEYGVSRETLERLLAYDAALLDWSSRHNLIARSTIEERWERHFRDSAQLYAFIPEEGRLLADLGSGAGFPGLVLAALGEKKGLEVILVESIGKKAAFLLEAIDAMRLKNTRVIPQRIENLKIKTPDVITARALARLPKLLAHAYDLGGQTALSIFPKGQDVDVELTDATKCWHMKIERRASVTNPGSTVLLIRELRPKRPPA